MYIVLNSSFTITMYSKFECRKKLAASLSLRFLVVNGGGVRTGCVVSCVPDAAKGDAAHAHPV